MNTIQLLNKAAEIIAERGFTPDYAVLEAAGGAGTEVPILPVLRVLHNAGLPPMSFNKEVNSMFMQFCALEQEDMMIQKFNASMIEKTNRLYGPN